MTPREWACFQCGSRFATDSNGDLVEYALTEIRCGGCLALLAILQESRHLRALMVHRVLATYIEPSPPLTPAQILARLRPAPAVPDYAKLAANDRDED
jgi:hypothetical protein